MSTVEVPEVDHALMRRRVRLHRSLSTFANFALTYSSVGAAAGIFSLFAFSLDTAGPAMFWAWITVGVVAGVLCLVWAELASHYPYAGAIYQWSALLAGRRIGWWVGWIYLFAGIWVTAAWYFVLPAAFVPLFNLSGTQAELVGISLIALGVAAVFNALGIEILGKFTKYGVFVELTVLVVFTVVVIAASPHHQNPSVLVSSGGTARTFGAWVPALLAGGIFMSTWVLYSFENGGTLGEETLDAHRKAPKAVLISWAVVIGLGIIFLVGFLTSIGNLSTIMKSSTPLQDIIAAALPSGFVKFYLVAICFITILGANAYFAGIVRHVFSMARDDQLPFARVLSKTRESTGAPWVAVLVVAVVTGLPFVASRSMAVLSTGATACIYVCYFLVSCIFLVSKFRGWPGESRAPFRLGRWGAPVAVAAVVLSGAIMVELFWFRTASDPAWHGMPVAFWLLALPLVLGAIYYPLRVHRRLPSTVDDVESPVVVQGLPAESVLPVNEPSTTGGPFRD